MKKTLNNKLTALLFGVLFISSSAFSQNGAGSATGAAADKSFRPNSTSTNGSVNNTTQLPAQKDQTTPRVSGTTTDTWVMTKNENGIKAYLKAEVLPEGRFIAIKFENTTDSEVSFSWKINQNGKTVQQSFSKLTVKSKSTEVFFDPTVMVKLKNNESINQFSIKIL